MQSNKSLGYYLYAYTCTYNSCFVSRGLLSDYKCWYDCIMNKWFMRTARDALPKLSREVLAVLCDSYIR